MIDLELELIKSATFSRDAYIEIINNAVLFTRHGDLLDVLQRLDDEGLAFDVPSIHARLLTTMPDVDATALIMDLVKCSGSTVNYRDHLKQLARARNGERIRDLTIDIMRAAKDKTMTTDEAAEHILSVVEGLHNYNTITDETVSQFAGRELDDIYNTAIMHKTGVVEIDEKIYGIANGQVIIIAARPSQGKTALAMQVAEHLSKTGREGDILFFSLETKKRNLYARLLARHARVESWKIQHKKMDEGEMLAVVASHEHYKNAGLNIYIFDDITDLPGIKKKIKKYKNIRAIIVDYLQLVNGGMGHTREQQVASISREFKNIAQRLDVPVLLLSQMSRAIEMSNREPQLSDLRESGAIEQDADVVIFIHAAEDQKHNKVAESSFIIAKNKDGATGKVLTTFNKPFFTFAREIKSDMDWINN